MYSHPAVPLTPRASHAGGALRPVNHSQRTDCAVVLCTRAHLLRRLGKQARQLVPPLLRRSAVLLRLAQQGAQPCLEVRELRACGGQLRCCAMEGRLLPGHLCLRRLGGGLQG